MNPLIQFKSTTLSFLIVSALICFGLSPVAHAVVPPPDGGYPGGNTAEGTEALNSLNINPNARVTAGLRNTAIGFQTLFSNTASNNNTAVGYRALFPHSTGDGNTAVGAFALESDTGGEDNTALGMSALVINTTGIQNTAVGTFALGGNTGKNNTAVGFAAIDLVNGDNNIALGVLSGNNIGVGSNNIDIGNEGVIGDANTIRIGTAFNADQTSGQNKTFIAGIRGVTTTNADAIAVVIDSAGQLGTAGSSERFKKDIGPMDKASEAILALKPVRFHYKNDTKGIAQFGLIAEEVAKVNPDLVVRDKNGEIYTVRYEAVNAMLLNEFLKEHRKVEEQEHTIAELKSGMEALAATVKEQAAQIQKVSAHLEATKVVPQMVLNNR